MLFYAVICATLALTSAVLVTRIKGQKHATPSPKGWPLLGHTPYMVNSKLHITLKQWADELGGVFLVNILRKSCFIISSAAAVEKVLSTRGTGKCLKAPQVYDPSLELTFGQPSLFNDCEEGESYHAFRKGLAPAFSDKAMRAVYPSIRSKAEKLAAMWRGAAVCEAGRQQPPSGSPASCEALDIGPWMQRCFLDIIGTAGFGLEFDAMDGGHSSIFQVVHDAVVVYDRQSVQPLEVLICRWLPMLPLAKEANRAMAKFRDTFSGFLEEFVARGEPDPSDTRIWAQLMRVKDPKTGRPYPDTMIKGNIAILLVAGFDTSSWTATWALYDIARNPECQRRIVQELADAGLLQVPGRVPARNVEWADLNLPYFNAVLKESMRLHPVAGIGTVRVAPHDMELEKCHVRKGDLLWVPISCVHTSVHNFTEPMKFDPGRWLPEVHEGAQASAGADKLTPDRQIAGSSPALDQQQVANAPGSSLPPLPPGATSPSAACPFASMATRAGHAAAKQKSMLPFSDGPRNCIGLNFAYVGVRTVLLTLLSSFWFELGDELKDHALVEASQVLVLVVQSGIPIKLHLKRHTEHQCNAS